MCFEAVWAWVRAWVAQTKARFRYQVERYHARRARRKWLKMELGGDPPGGTCYWKYNCDVMSGSSHTSGHLQHPYRPTTYVVDEAGMVERADVEQGVGVLSPQRLSQRLNENALAREAVGESDAELAQYLKDERIALFLQNDEFINELRTNREFMTALQEDYESEAGDEDEAEGAKGKGQLAQLDDATLREKIATMGKASRKKFAQIAKVFSRGKHSGGRSVTSREQLLNSQDAMVEDEDDERPQPQPEGALSYTLRQQQQR
ncbi:hypothetical protein Pcinc_008931 [Petrolisthes cinctipes]|uniref:CUE domain-containing protein n=1 Tax=Petrolisthes cinctipes TaxID=88211 RepID=A0AAE1G7W6_PETCI|nr:hypothetical protein Pcinc_008931 [Petrolisthes cinctipes]